MNTQDRDIAVIGMACRFPRADDIVGLWRVLTGGEVAFTDIGDNRWKHSSFYDPLDLRATDKTYAKKGAFINGIEDFAALHFGIAPRRVQVMDPQQRLLVETTQRALADAGYDKRAFDRRNTGVFVGVSVNEYKDLLVARVRAQMLVDGTFGEALTRAHADAVRAASADVVPMRAFSIAGGLLNMIAATVSQTFDLAGPSLSLDTACSSALVAVHEAVLHLRAGQCNVALAGGVYVNLVPDNLIGFSRIGAISIAGVCRPFDARADGFVMGEGVGVVVLKRLTDALADRDRIYAVIKGSGTNNDGRGDGPMTPRVEGQMDAMSRAHRDTQMPVETLGYVETHGTATTVGDAVEVAALRRFFEQSAGGALTKSYCYLASIKANIGHTMSAAGIAGFIKTALVLHHRTIVPQPGCEQLNPELDLDSSPFRIAREAMPWPAPAGHPRRAAVSSFGFGGSNAHVLLEEAPVAEVARRKQPELFLVSAPNRGLLAAHLRELADTIASHGLAPADVACTLATRTALDARMAFVATTREELVESLRAAADDPQRFGCTAAPAGAPGCRVAFLFPGQGAQRVGMIEGLASRFAGIGGRLAALGKHANFLDALHPQRPYDVESAQRRLTRTEICQPAMTAIGVSLGEMLLSLGVEPALVLGHSVGEFAAAALAGMISAEQAIELAAKRGALINALELPDAGAMMAVMAGRAAIEREIDKIDGVCIANVNHPTQVVLSGTSAGIGAAREHLESKDFRVTRLDVSHAFHSALMRRVDTGMGGLLAPLSVQSARVPVVSCITGDIYATGESAKEAWARHASATVEFVNALKTSVAMGVNVFIQVGAGNSLLSFARAAAPNAAFLSLAPAQDADDGSVFLATLGQLFVRGMGIDVSPIYDTPDRRLVTLPPVPLDTQRYWGIERPVTRAAQVVSVPSVPAEPPVASENLVALFREQMALLQSQAQIMQTQAAALVQRGIKVPEGLSQPVRPAVFKEFSASVDATHAEIAGAQVDDLRASVQSAILSAVARISAFPATALKLEHTLTGDLGFDSLMLVELDADLVKTWPQLGGLPADFLDKSTTVANLIDHLVPLLEGGDKAPPAMVPAQDSPVARYAPSVVPLPLRSLREAVLSFDAPVLILEDPMGIAHSLAAKLGARGIAVKVGGAQTSGHFAGAISFAGAQGSPLHALLDLARRLGVQAQCFVTVTTLGGDFGFSGVARGQLEQVGALGFTKALAQEWNTSLVKAIDVDARLGADAIAQCIVDELFSADRRVEVGFTRAGRVGVALVPATRAAAPELAAEAVVLVTGGSTGIGFAFAQAIAGKYGCSLALASRAPSEKAAAAVKAAGARACSLHVMDACDASSVRQTVDAVRNLHGRLDAVIHAAGIIADSPVQTKDIGKFDAVVHTKVEGALVLLDATIDDKLKFLALVGSWSGRFGNAGQTDYSAASEMMARIAADPRAGTRIIAIDFPPFVDSTMAKRIPPHKKRALLEAGVTFLTEAQGVDAFLTEIASGHGEVLIGRAVPERLESYRAAFPVSRLSHFYLNDHVMDGQCVLPLAAALDHLAAAAIDACPEFDNGFSVRQFQLNRPVLVPDSTSFESRVDYAVSRTQPPAIRVVLNHIGARAYSATFGRLEQERSSPSIPLASAGWLPMSVSEFYAHHTFHGPLLQGIASIDALSDDGIAGTVRSSTPAAWVKESLRAEWTVDPLVIDAGFQLAAYWAWVKHGRAGFPVGFREFNLFEPFGAGPVLCTVHLEAATGDRFVGTFEWHDAQGRLLAEMKGVEAEFTQRDLPVPAAAVLPDPSTYDPARFPEYEALGERMKMAARLGLQNPYFSVHEAICGDTTVVNGKKMINFSSYNYLGNSGDAVVSTAAKAAIDQYGTSVSASRVASGENPLTARLEEELAGFFGTEASLVFVSGHATNVTVIGHLCGAGDLILHDALAHDSIIQGATLAGAKRRAFAHNDWGALDRALDSLRGHYRRVLVCIEGVYSMDGDIPDLPRFIAVKKKHKAMLLVDEAHSAGVVGASGRGIGEHWNVERTDVDLWMGTLSKSFASCGGYICGSKALVEYLKYTVPGFVYSVGISPPNAAAALAALGQLKKHPERVATLRGNAERFLALLKERGIDTGMSKDSAVVPAIIGDSALCLQLSERLKIRGINVQPILYPAVEERQARLRFFVSALHSDEQLLSTANILAEECDHVKRGPRAGAAA